jgi:hypothetical protein
VSGPSLTHAPAHGALSFQQEYQKCDQPADEEAGPVELGAEGGEESGAEGHEELADEEEGGEDVDGSWGDGSRAKRQQAQVEGVEEPGANQQG